MNFNIHTIVQPISATGCLKPDLLHASPHLPLARARQSVNGESEDCVYPRCLNVCPDWKLAADDFTGHNISANELSEPAETVCH
ncbi:hypothetical protein CEXT_370881 [Caerostris extrusa]|uniref:Uncharacterized protein n=1 Tax=Caerostris extrusa TaxID=172846 RepID=A0AAV4MU31_CAEEX|nr:hypothetical protein CEXT_370881 [Caerostris extrusa]